MGDERTAAAPITADHWTTLDHRGELPGLRNGQSKTSVTWTLIRWSLLSTTRYQWSS